MTLAWFVCGYDTMLNPKTGYMSMRACSMNRFSAQILADGGYWSEIELMNNFALCKVSASSTTINAIGNTNGFYKVTDHFILDDSLADLTVPQRNTIQNQLLQIGYTQAEIDATIGNSITLWRQKTFSTLLIFCSQFNSEYQWDAINHQITVKNARRPASKTVAKLDSEVT